MTELVTCGSLSILPSEISLAAVLRNGQSFRWRLDADKREWSFAWRDRVLLLKQLAHGIEYSAFFRDAEAFKHDQAYQTTHAFLHRYLALETSLKDLYDHWSATDKNFVSKTENGRFGGIRVLRQDPFETLICFISSTNNNISRIALMINRLCEEYGTQLDGPPDSKPHYAFPSPQQLAPPQVEQRLRELGFGYRAAYVQKSCQLLLDLAREQDISPEEYLDGLSRKPYPEARESLLQFTGVGPKVADCIALFGLGMDHVVPVDTHVWQIATRDYQFKGGKEAKGPINALIYAKVQARLQEVWGEKAGWAQQILFTADLRSFANFSDPLSTPPVTPVKEEPKVLESKPTQGPLSLPTTIKQEDDPIEEDKQKWLEDQKRQYDDVKGNSLAERIKARRRSSSHASRSSSPTKKVKSES